MLNMSSVMSLLRAGRSGLFGVHTRCMSKLPHSRSLEQASTTDTPEHIPRSVDAPADPFDRREEVTRPRDTQGMSKEEVNAQVTDAINRGSARSTEALGGRAGQLSANPTFHMNQMAHPGSSNSNPSVRSDGFDKPPAPGSHDHDTHGTGAAADWARDVVGEGYGVRLAEKTRDAVKKMFSPGGVSNIPGTGSDSSDRKDSSGDDAIKRGQLPGARKSMNSENVDH